MERMPRPRRPEQKMVPSQKPEKPDPDLDVDDTDVDDTDVDDTDVDADDDKKWNDWANDDTGRVEVPLVPLQQPEMGIHAPPPEMDDRDMEEQKKRREQEEGWNKENDADSVPRGYLEMKS